MKPDRKLAASAAILIGGKSSRFGSDKAFLNLEGRPLALVLCDRFAAMLDDVLLISNLPDKLLAPNARTLADLLPEQGPLGGLHTALSRARHAWCFLTACDLPFLSMELLLLLWERREKFDIVLPRHNSRIEPLAGFYHCRCLPKIREMLDSEDRAMRGLCQSLNVNIVDLEPHFDEQTLQKMFHNVNTPEQHARALELLRKP